MRSAQTHDPANAVGRPAAQASLPLLLGNTIGGDRLVGVAEPRQQGIQSGVRNLVEQAVARIGLAHDVVQA